MSSYNGNSLPRGNSHTFTSYSVTRQNWQGRGRKPRPPIVSTSCLSVLLGVNMTPARRHRSTGVTRLWLEAFPLTCMGDSKLSLTNIRRLGVLARKIYVDGQVSNAYTPSSLRSLELWFEESIFGGKAGVQSNEPTEIKFGKTSILAEGLLSLKLRSCADEKKAPPSKRVLQRTEKDSEADKKPAEPKPKPGTREFAKWKLDFHKKKMIEAIEEQELAAQKLATNRAKAVDWQRKVDEWEKKGKAEDLVDAMLKEDIAEQGGDVEVSFENLFLAYAMLTVVSRSDYGKLRTARRQAKWVMSSNNYDKSPNIARKQIFIKKAFGGFGQKTGAFVSKIYSYKDEVIDAEAAIELALSLGVRAPRIRRIVLYEGNVECIMGKVRGVTLMDAWAHISWYRSACLAFQLRYVVKLMQSQSSPTAGSLGTGICRSFWLERDIFGIPPHSSPCLVASIVNFWYNLVSLRVEKAKSTAEHFATCREPIQEQPFVLTHHDLAPRNIMVDDQNKLWLVDWDKAGWYPSYFEYAGMHNFWIPKNWSRLDRLRWTLFFWIATGWYEQEREIIEHVRSRLARFPMARRFNVKAGATPAAREVDG
ncbi:putative Aminoglycoside phosphotransferase domain-containing protein [Seiridium unicorne]|uniref:Aminoglycoside phosphotransferase domain-containing protein n=1 Tax=Seiridium unicorne TaxID=138068 RepID=A0ABR2UIL4_9PEZI